MLSKIYPQQRWVVKSETEKKQKGGLCGNRQNDRASPEVRGAGIFGGWGLPCIAARNLLTGET